LKKNKNFTVFLSLNRRYSAEQRDLDDADEDGNTVYRGLAVPVDIRQVVEVSQYFNRNFNIHLETLIDIRWL
jgi:hypothetical protein